MKNQPAVPWPLRYLLIASLLILLLAVGSEMARFQSAPTGELANRTGPQDGAIVPGVRIDFVALGAPIHDVERVLGAGKIKPTSEATLYHFATADLTCGVQEGKVSSVLTRNPLFKTRTGLHVGSVVDDVVREYGDSYEYEKLSSKPDEELYTVHYWKSGIHFTVKLGMVQSVLVTPSLNQDASHS